MQSGLEYFIKGTVDPTITAINALQGTLYVRGGGAGGTVYQKQDDGLTTNWTKLSTGAAAVTTTSVNNAASPYTILTTDQFILCDTSTGPIQLNLPDPTIAKRYFYVLDVGGQAESNNITLHRFAAENIENLASDKPLQTNYGGWLILDDLVNFWMA